VHHLLVSHQEQIFEPIFIHDSYACRKGKGSPVGWVEFRRYPSALRLCVMSHRMGIGTRCLNPSYVKQKTHDQCRMG
jgi:hypothetical protein